MHDFVSSFDFTNAAQLRLSNGQLQHLITIVEEQVQKHHEEMEHMQANTALALQLQKYYQEEMAKMEKNHQAQSSRMAKQRDAALRAQAAVNKLLVKAIAQKNQLNATHVQWASDIAASYSQLQADKQNPQNPMCGSRQH